MPARIGTGCRRDGADDCNGVENLRNKVRLDCLMVEQGCAESREKAKAIIMAGDVFIQNQRYDKPGMLVPKDSQLDVRGGLRYVSRGGLKLEKAMQKFPITLERK
ncbi:MAG TPA: hypothetical protein DHW78_02190, partial [Ruminococcaceae bacterium]|nr:hypothetical protein [Oscillospiraceae bacterium]